ncbi:MAG: hypothetical protein A2Y78_00205 [Acidobacteria bacterium RBG_13_68_16]|nr:MAG: hypothetical protein A2Y78_00205 [Acidobacteria bacterium RBG_13_68_16]
MAEIQARRAATRAALEEARNTQLATDLEEIEAVELQYGPSSVVVEHPVFAPGLPAAVAVRCPKTAEVKRYQDTIRPSKRGDMGDPIQAARQLGLVCLAYPPQDSPLRAALLEQRPGIEVDFGNAAMRLVAAKAEDEGKG